MNFKKYLKSYLRAGEERSARGQAIVEYIILFSILVIVIVITFGGLSPDNLKLGSDRGLTRIFQQAVQGAVSRINHGWH